MNYKKILLALALLISVLSAPARTQEKGTPERSRIQLENQGGASPQEKGPLPTLDSGEEAEVEICRDDPVLEGLGFYKIFRYGTLSNGPVSVQVAAEKIPCFARVMDERGEELARAGGGKEETPLALEVICRAGDEIRILLGAALREEPCSLRIMVLEKNQEEGEETVSEVIQKARALLSKSKKEKNAGALPRARELLKNALSAFNHVPGTRQSKQAMNLLWKIGKASYTLNDLETAALSYEKVIRFREATLPIEHPDLLGALNNYATTIAFLDELQKAKSILERVVKVRERILSPDHSLVQSARLNLAMTMGALDDLQGARSILEKVIHAYEKTLSPDHRSLQAARMNLALTLGGLGDLQGSRSLLEKVVESYERTLPPEHLELQKARMNLAVVLGKLGNLENKSTLLEKIVGVYERTLPPDHPELQKARFNLALILIKPGDLQRKKTLLEAVLVAYEKSHPAENPALQDILLRLAATLFSLGDLYRASSLQEKVLEVRERTLHPDHPDLQTAKLILAVTLRKMGSLQRARAYEESVLEVRERTLSPEHPKTLSAWQGLAITLKELGETKRAREIEEKILEVRERTLPPDHPSILSILQNLAITLKDFGELERAREIEEKILDERERTLPPEDFEVLAARVNLMETLRRLGELPRAKSLGGEVLEVRERILPPDHHDLQLSRQSLALVHYDLGEFRRAKTLQEKILEVRERICPADHAALQSARTKLAFTIKALGEYQRAHDLEEKVVKIYEQTLPPEHIKLQSARANLAASKKALGDLHGAYALEEMVLRIDEKTLPPDHPNLQMARSNLGATLALLDDFYGARALFETALEVREKILPPSHRDLQSARLNLAAAMCSLGDYYGARALFEKVLEVSEATLPADHPHLQDVRMNLAATMGQIGDLRGALSLFEKILEVKERSLSPDHRECLIARQNIAATAFYLGDHHRAHSLFEKVLNIRKQILSPDNPDLQETQLNLAKAKKALGDLLGAWELGKEVLAIRNHTPSRDEMGLPTARIHLAETCLLLGKRKDAKELTDKAIKGTKDYIFRREKTGAVREIDASVSQVFWILNHYLSLGRVGCFTPEESFLVSELFRAAGARTGAIRRIAAKEGGEKIRKLRENLTRANLKVATALGEIEAVIERDKAEAAVAEALESLPGSKKLRGWSTLAKIAAVLSEGWAGLSISKYTFIEHQGKGIESSKQTPSYVAFVLHRRGEVERIELGPAALIDREVNLWRKGLLQPRSSGRESEKAAQRIQELLWKPIRKRLGDAKKLVIAPDSVFATVPLEALTYEGGVLSDKFTVAYANSLSSLALPGGKISDQGADLVAFGGIDYNTVAELAQEKALGKRDSGTTDAFPMGPASQRSAPRGKEDDKAAPLPGTAIEAKAVARLFKDSKGKKALLIEGAQASKAALIALAQRARYLHIATHGYFAPEKVKSFFDREGEEKRQFISSRQEKVTGLAPSLLCGLKLAGCNLPRETAEDSGVITAEEIQGLDLSNCKLAVLSACESNVGEVRTGQGVMSLQRALGIAGSRGSVTSLWKVDDKATTLFFMEFYRLLWEEEMPPWDALRQAKLWLKGLTVAEVNNLLTGLPQDEARGISVAPLERDLSPADHPYEHPYYWASFVYWGRIE